MTCSNFTLSPDNSIVIEHTVTNPLKDPIYENNATVTVDIKDTSGVSIPEMPASLFYVSGSDGVYRQTFESLTVTPNKTYTVLINATTPDPLEFTCKQTVKAVERGC